MVLDPDDPRLDDGMREAFGALHTRRRRAGRVYERRRRWRVAVVALVAAVLALAVGVVVGAILWAQVGR